MPPIISVKHLSKTYGSGFKALNDVNLDIQLLPGRETAQRRVLRSMGDDVDREMRASVLRRADFVHRQRNAVERDRALRSDHRRQVRGRADADARRIALCASPDNCRDGVDMTGDDMPAKLVPEAKSALEKGLVIPAYEATLACSHQFNVLDARGAVSATDRVGLIRRVRDLACACARAWVSSRAGTPVPAAEPEPATAV